MRVRTNKSEPAHAFTSSKSTTIPKVSKIDVPRSGCSL